MAFRIFTDSIDDEQAVVAAMRAIEPVEGRVWGAEQEDAIRALRTRRWWVFQYKHEVAEPGAKPADEITLRDLHSALTDVLTRQGAKMVVELMRKYRLLRLADLPASRYGDFLADARMAFHTVTTYETRTST